MRNEENNPAYKQADGQTAKRESERQDNLITERNHYEIIITYMTA